MGELGKERERRHEELDQPLRREIEEPAPVEEEEVLPPVTPPAEREPSETPGVPA